MLHESLAAKNFGSLAVNACLIKSGTLGDVLGQLFPNLQQLSVHERQDVLHILVDKFPAKTERSLVESIDCSRSESLAGEDRGSSRRAKTGKDSSDGSEPLPHPGHEAAAQFMSSLRSERAFKTIAELAKYAAVTPKTIHLWKKDFAVLRRAQYLTRHKKVQGDLIGRRAWPQVMRGQVKKAAAGDTAAARFVAERAWPEETKSGLSDLSAEQLLKLTFSSEAEAGGPASTMEAIEGRPD